MAWQEWLTAGVNRPGSCAPLWSSSLSKTLSLSLSVLAVACHSVATATTATVGLWQLGLTGSLSGCG